MSSKKLESDDLRNALNIGPAVYKDLLLLQIRTFEELSQADPDELYLRLEEITDKHHDPCVWDVFAAIIHAARTGQQMPWWHWTPIRKKKQLKKPLCCHYK